jgi:hypothetical protein
MKLTKRTFAFASIAGPGTLLACGGAFAASAKLDSSARAEDASTDALADLLRLTAEVPDSAKIDAPSLWSFQLVDATGTPVEGQQVVALVVDRSGVVPAKEGVETNAPVAIPVARAISGPDGEILLRLDPKSVMDFTDRSGWLDLTFQVGSGSDPLIWKDSVFFPGAVFDSGSSFEEWSTSTASHVALSDGLPIEEVAKLAQGDPQIETEQPSVVQLNEKAATPIEPERANLVSRSLRAPIPIPTGCIPKATVANGYARVTVGSFLLKENWTSTFLYTNSATTAIGVTVAAGVGSGPFSGTVGGTVNVTSKTNSTVIQQAEGAPSGTTVGKKFEAFFDFSTERWECTSTYPNSPVTTKLVTFPTNLRNDLAPVVQNVALPTCTRKDRTVLPGQSYQRGSGSAWASSGAAWSIAVTPPGGTAFAIGAQSTTVHSSLNYQNWINNATGDQYLCGVNNANLGATTAILAFK